MDEMDKMEVLRWLTSISTHHFMRSGRSFETPLVAQIRIRETKWTYLSACKFCRLRISFPYQPHAHPRALPALRRFNLEVEALAMLYFPQPDLICSGHHPSSSSDPKSGADCRGPIQPVASSSTSSRTPALPSHRTTPTYHLEYRNSMGNMNAISASYRLE
jgi:hypothetical protein